LLCLRGQANQPQADEPGDVLGQGKKVRHWGGLSGHWTEGLSH
jgi:hypothetical protein